VNGTFDLIFCRNVLIYFDRESKARVVDRLLSHLTPEGYLFLGFSETTATITDRLTNAGPNVYTRVPDDIAASAVAV
jgi:chemotaxis protein methyltransferase CheR